MRGFLVSIAAAATLVAGTALADRPVITVLGETLIHDQEPGARAAPADVQRLAEAMRGRIFRHYVAEHGLRATAEEIAELGRYNDEFERRDRAQRARKLTELEQRLQSEGLAPEERAHLEDFRATLARLAAYEAEQDRKPASPEQPDFAPWIEMWKLHPAIYERYGGVVVRAPFGHYPQGAWAALIADYERRGELEFHDAGLRAQVLGFFSAPPRGVVDPKEVDFTPYWRRPIPPSYFPDEVRETGDGKPGDENKK